MSTYQRSRLFALATVFCLTLGTAAMAASPTASSDGRMAQTEAPAAPGSAPENTMPMSPRGAHQDMMNDDMMGGMMSPGMKGMARSGMMSHGRGAWAEHASGMMSMS